MARKCINLNSTEFQSLVQQTGKNPIALASFVSTWMEDNNTDEWPSIEIVNNSFKLEKPGHQYLRPDLENEDPYLQVNSTEHSNIKEALFKDNNEKSLNEIVSKLTGNNHILGKLAKHLLKYTEETDTKVVLVEDDFTLGNTAQWAGMYYRQGNVIYFKKNTNLRVLMHEIIHALTVNQIRFNSEDAKVKELNNLYEYAKKHINSEDYGFTNIYEFVAELYSNREFAEKLMSIKASKPSKYKNLFEEFFEAMLKFLGFSKSDTLYSHAYAVTSNIIEDQYANLLLEKQFALQNESIFNQETYEFNPTGKLDKESSLYKRLIKSLPEREANRIYKELTSDEFNKWYEGGTRDKDGFPIITSQFYVSNIVNSLRNYNLLHNVQFKNVGEVEKFFTSMENTISGISKYKNAFYISKNNHKNGMMWFELINKTHPNLLKLAQKKAEPGVLGMSDQSRVSARIVIDPNYFSSEEYYPMIEEQQIKESPIDFIINRLEEYKSRVYNNYRDAKRDKDTANIIKYETLYKELQEDLVKLHDEKTEMAITEQAEKDLKYVSNILSKRNFTNKELKEVGRIIDLYSNIDSVDSRSSLLEPEDLQPTKVIKVDSEGKEYIEEDVRESVKRIQKIATKFRALDATYTKIIKEIVLEEFNSTYDRDITMDQLFADVTDLNFMDGTRGVLSMRNELLNLLGTVRTQAENRANSETIENIKEIEDKTANLKNSSLFNKLGKTKFFELFWKKDEDGKVTNGLINRYSKEYWKYINDYRSRLNSKNKGTIAKAKKDHYNNHEYINYFETEEEKQLEIDRLSEIFDRDFVTELVEAQEFKFQEYRERKEEKQDSLNENDSLTQERRDFEMEKWVKENNPVNTINSLKTGMSETNPDGGFYFNSFEFVKSIPLKVTRDGKETKWFDSAFEQIEADPIAKDYYEFTRSRIKELLGFYPQSYLDQKNIHGGFIPQIKKQVMKEFKLSGLTFKGLKKSAFDLVSIKTFSKANNHIDPKTGEPINALNIAMLSPKYSEVVNGRIEEGSEIVTDIDEILKGFTSVTNMYKHKSRVEATHELIVESISELKGLSTNASNSTLLNYKNENFSGKLNKLQELVQFEVDTFYNIQDIKNEKTSGEKKLTTEEKDTKEKLQEELSKIETKLSTDPELTEEDIKKLNRAKSNIGKEIEDLGRSFSQTKSVKSVLRWYQLLSQGWNIPSSVIELVYGWMSNFTHSAMGVDFTEKQLKRAYKIAMGNIFTGGKSKEATKFNNVIEKFNIIGEVFEIDDNAVLNSKVIKGAKKFLSPYEIARQADKVSKGSAAIAMMLNTKVYDINGEESNLYDALDEYGNLKDNFKSEENLKDWVIDYSSKEANKLEKLRSKIIQVNVANMGNYDPSQPIPVNSKAAGKAVLQFRRWLLEGFAQRWQAERLDNTLGRKVKGRYRTYGTLGAKQSISIAFKMLLNKINPFAEKFTDEQLREMGIEEEVDIQNMRKNVVGIIMAISVYLMLLLLSNLAGDDEDKDFGELNFLINMGGRLQSDLWFYTNPGEANSFLGNIVPAARLYDKTIDWADNVLSSLIPEYDEDYNPVYRSGDFKGWNKSLIKTGELIPGTSSLIKLKRLSAKVIE